ncbi:MAG: CPBP family glutamic-type intramembrane protease [Thermofilaceae archaeon]|nr:CPBP family glutamic-type intramembrane protease [Thermofilaceae archaeon]MCX8180167.1 CPBP family glutamic-type intramembrane protease [Thermofilaceae archaeon]MDW8004177.1 CPBP family glutamic-type intramembrane protease [Thermofilaceae archaeon]
MKLLQVSAILASTSVLLLLLNPEPLFYEVFDKAKTVEFSRSLEAKLGLISGYSRVTYFEIKATCLCTSVVEKARSLNEYRGKEWVTRLYKGQILAYELRMDASMGFSSIYVNFSFVDPSVALKVAAELLSTTSGGVYVFDFHAGGLKVYEWQQTPAFCLKAEAEALSWEDISVMINASLAAFLIVAFILVLTLDTPGLRKRRVVLSVFLLLFLANSSRTILNLHYWIGKRQIPPTSRSIIQFVHGDIISSLLVCVVAVAGVALKSRNTPFRLPESNEVLDSWFDGLSAGAFLASVMLTTLFFAAQAETIMPLALPSIEEALSTQHPALTIILSTALTAISSETVFRLLLLPLLNELTGKAWHAIVLSSVIFSLSYIGYPLYPPFAKVLQTLAFSLVVSILFMLKGFLTTLFTSYVYNVISAALSLFAIRPWDASLLVIALPLSIFFSLAIIKLARYVI